MDAAARAAVDAREAAGDEEKAAAAAMVGANAVTGTGKPAFLKTDAPQRAAGLVQPRRRNVARNDVCRGIAVGQNERTLRDRPPRFSVLRVKILKRADPKNTLDVDGLKSEKIEIKPFATLCFFG